MRLLPRSAHRIHAPVVAVAEVHVERPGLGEHRRVAGRAPAVRVAARDRGRRGTPRPRRAAPRHRCPDRTLLSSSGATVERVAVEEAPRQRACASHVCWRSIRSRASTSSRADGLGTGAARRRPAAHRAPGFEERRGSPDRAGDRSTRAPRAGRRARPTGGPPRPRSRARRGTGRRRARGARRCRSRR